MIERRVRAAAAGDFVVAFYNPVSQRRRELLEHARDLLLEHRPGATPIVLARNLGRPDATTRLIRLDELTADQCDMLTLVLVGSADTRRAPRLHGQDWVYTPRGYRVAMTVHFIGAGPGAPDLITVRGLRLIQRCPVCLYAGSLVPAEVVAAAPAGARVLDTAPMHLDEILAEIEAAHDRGEDVARVHSGDPSLYGAIAEQIRRLDALGHPLDDHARRSRLRRRGGGARQRAHPARGRPAVILTRTAMRASAMPAGEEPRRPSPAPAPRSCIHLSINNLAPIVPRAAPILGDDMPGGGRLPRHLARPAHPARHARHHPRQGEGGRDHPHRADHRRPRPGRDGTSARAGSTPPITPTSCGRGRPQAKPSPPAPSPRLPPAPEAWSASPPAAPARAPQPPWRRSARRRWPG